MPGGATHIRNRNNQIALRFVILLGVVSLFADMTYEAARSITGPGIRDVAYTPYLDKVLASIYWNTQAESKIMVLDAAAIAPGFIGTVPSSAYTFLPSNAAIIGPEGIAVSPLFDRDGDNISDLIEARNIGINLVNFRPTIIDTDPSRANGTPNNGSLSNGILLPEEGIGYRHRYFGPGGTGVPVENQDNWGTLKFIRLI